MTVPGLVFGTSLGNLGYTTSSSPSRCSPGTPCGRSPTILDKRESKSDSTRGIVWFDQRGYNQRDELVCRAKRTGMIMRLPVEAGAEAGHGP